MANHSLIVTIIPCVVDTNTFRAFPLVMPADTFGMPEAIRYQYNSKQHLDDGNIKWWRKDDLVVIHVNHATSVCPPIPQLQLRYNCYSLMHYQHATANQDDCLVITH